MNRTAPTGPGTRTLSDIEAEMNATATLRSLVGLLDAKLDLSRRYGLAEYEAAAAGEHRCADALYAMGLDELRHVDLLLELLTDR